jgi:GNAT superfamily N-acetyltransferase
MRYLYGRDLSDVGLPPELIASFARGWARTRGVTPPISDGGALRIETGLPEETRRYVCPQAPDAIAALGSKIAEPHVLIKAPIAPDQVAALLPPIWHVEQTGTIMTTEHLPLSEPALPSGYHWQNEWLEDVFFVHIETDTGDQIARGRMTFIDGWVLHDRVRVDDEHQRRGLGRAIMLALAHEARAAGHARGLLAATVAGRALYQTMGWQPRAPWTTAQIKG